MFYFLSDNFLWLQQNYGDQAATLDRDKGREMGREDRELNEKNEELQFMWDLDVKM